jgi:hypothetical protein
MKILVDSREYRCWHELGHAAVCVHLGGNVEFIELLSDDPRGHARTRCEVPPEIHRSVACGGFAAEFYLLKSGLAERRPDDDRDISRVVFHNATGDREDYWGRKLGKDEVFSLSEDTEFMHHAIGPDGQSGMIPILKRYHSSIEQLVSALCETRRVDRSQIIGLMQPFKPR